jgi:tRNA-dihydrouridine synthase B
MVSEEITGIVKDLKNEVKGIFDKIKTNYKIINEYDDLSLIEQNSFLIGNVKIKNPVVSAPMAGISDNTYRIFARCFGSSLQYSEMISSYGIFYRNTKSMDMVHVTAFEKPFALQLFGSKPEIIADAASIVQEKADIIDINMGCPVPKVLKTGSGGALLREEDLIKRIIKSLRKTINKPLTVKLRLGWDHSSININRTVKIAESEGANAVAVHARTVKQGYSGDADYSFLKELKGKIKIPLIVSGDIDEPFKALEVLNETGAKAMMIGRAARGNPWIFMEILTGIILMKRGIINESDIFAQKKFKKDIAYFLNNDIKVKILILYIKSLIGFMGEEKAVKEFRKILGWAFKGMRNINDIKKEFFFVQDFEEVRKVLNKMTGM